ncbi:MAG: energy transducer TonB [Bacteroidetes bacterium]|nr:energy transducer TonB [Bacteroidota bacterium]
MKHYLNYAKKLFVIFALIVHSLPAVVKSQEFKLLDNSQNRIVINKVLPPNPSNLDRIIKVPMSFTVLPNGTVGEIIPLIKGDPAVISVSLKTLKKWKFNPIEDDIIMKGEITFTFSPEGGDNSSTNVNSLSPTIKKSANTQKEKYYSVSHHSWGKFMNNNAVWINNKENSNQGKNTELSFTFNLSEDNIYDIEIAGDDTASLIIDGQKLSILSNFNDSDKFKLYLNKGEHICSVQLLNLPSSSSKWQDNPVGFGMVISAKGKVIVTTRDKEYLVNQSVKYYPVSHPVWNDLLKNHAVWINNKENNHEGEYKDLTFETTIPKSGFYNFEISADDTAEFILDGNKITDISYQKGIYNFKIHLEEGVHQLQMKVMNFILNKAKWEDNAVGAAILVKDNSGNIVFSTRDEKYCYEEQIENTRDRNIQAELKINKPIIERNKLINTKDDVKKLLFNSKWKVVYSYHGLDYLSKIQDKEYLKSTYFFNNDRLTVSKNDGSILLNSNCFIGDITEQSNELTSFKLIIPLTKKEQEFNGRKQDVYIIYIMDINTLKVCDSQYDSPCESHFTIKRYN